MKKKVLLVEDDDTLSLALKLRLDAMGYSPLIAKNVSSAMSMVVSRKPDISLIDVNLPDGSGFSLAKQIQNSPNTPNIPLIFISACSLVEYKEQATFYSSAPLLEKPFETSQLIKYLEFTHNTSCNKH